MSNAERCRRYRRERGISGDGACYFAALPPEKLEEYRRRYGLSRIADPADSPDRSARKRR